MPIHGTFQEELAYLSEQKKECAWCKKETEKKFCSPECERDAEEIKDKI